MNNDIYPCVWMDHNGREAAAFYTEVFPDTIITEDSGLVQILSISGQKLMLLNGGPMFKPNASISFLIANADETETERLFNLLAADGIVLMPLDHYPFSSRYGWVRDRFGVTWQLYTGEKGDTDQYFVPTLMFVNEQNGRAKEAIGFYTRLFPGSSTEGIMEYDGKEDKKGNVQHAQFKISGYTLACMDSSIDHTFNFDEGISIAVMTNDQETTDYYWNAMTQDGGEESMCGWLKDKFGVSWQIVPHRLMELFNQKDQEKASRTREAMMKMRKIDIAKLEEAGA
ncbi:VOC family protein [Niabella insulamsoli]|uniref:VOC family protein n=1 Tax=Niabella insulamsoli TaxID=3144874 RepID=UPI0031FC9B39